MIKTYNTTKRGQPFTTNGSFGTSNRRTYGPAPVIDAFTSPQNWIELQNFTASPFVFTAANTPTSWTLFSGSLPTGLTFNTTGVDMGKITGTISAATAGSYSITVKANNSNGASDPATLAITVVAGPPTTNLWGHWKASEAYDNLDGTGTKVENDGDPVYSLKDLKTSGTMRHYNQGTAASKPFYKTNIKGTIPSILFDGSNDLMSCATYPAGTKLTVIAVLKIFSSGGAILSYFTGIGSEIRLNSSTNLGWQVSGDNDPKVTNDANVGVLFTTFNDASSVASWNNGTLDTGTPNKVAFDSNVLGFTTNDLYANFHLLELIVYHHATDGALDPTSGDGLSVMTYINAKYNLW